ncbi:MAG TPA: cytochrome b/b6 domain-containing protein [Novosphingobium sp.]|nr:cytochrome b/b6 domain-containing protein [Novosphingobium sp.]
MTQSLSPARYTAVAVVLHWLVAIGIFYNLWAGLGFDDLWAAVDKGALPAETARAAVELHKSIGITVLGLVVLRVLWKIGHPAPAPLAGLKPWEKKLSIGIHHLLYLLIVLVPFSGWLHDSAWKAAASHPLVLFNTVPWFRLPLFGGLDDAGKDHWHAIFGGIHAIGAKVLIAALLLHVAGALKHQFLDGQKLLQRMWFGR